MECESMSDTRIETFCPECNKEVTGIEIAINSCSYCHAELKTPIQNATVTVDPLPMFGITF